MQNEAYIYIYIHIINICVIYIYNLSLDPKARMIFKGSWGIIDMYTDNAIIADCRLFIVEVFYNLEVLSRSRLYIDCIRSLNCLHHSSW